MPGISHEEISSDEDLGRVLLLRAYSIAPPLRTVADESQEKRNAIAVLRRVAKRAAEAGTGAVESLGRNGSSMKLRDVGDAFRPADIGDLRLIFGLPEPARAVPLGSFPKERPLSHLWPEEYA